MSYKSYRQIAHITLKSNDANEIQNAGNRLINAANEQINTSYKFNINLPFIKFTKNTHMAVQKVAFKPSIQNNILAIGDIFITNLKKSNVYHSGNKKGTCIFTGSFANSFEYVNQDTTYNSIDITNHTTFLENNNGIELFVDTKVLDDAAVDIGGIKEFDRFSISLIIFEFEKEEF